jgi:hypothetical protein
MVDVLVSGACRAPKPPDLPITDEYILLFVPGFLAGRSRYERR